MNRKGRVTIEDVAAAAGVSRQTVSRVINDGPNVKPALREKVRAAIEALGYVPNLSARRMGGGRSFLILAVNDRNRTLENWSAGRGNDWVDQMLYGGMTECERHSYHLVFELIETQDKEAERQLAKALAALRPDGVILTPPHSDNESLVALLEAQKLPCARIGHREGHTTIDVFMDEAGAARDTTRGLIELGHRRVGFIAGAANYGNSALRIEGFREALAEAGLPDSVGHVGFGEFHFDTAAGIIREMLQQPESPTALIAENDEMAFAAMHVANSLNISIPEQLSVVSFEDTPGVRFSVPPLSAVRQPTAQMIATACRRLIEAARGGEAHSNEMVPYDLMWRASTGPTQY